VKQKVIYEKAREDAARWCKQVLVPLMQQTLEAKKRIDEQLKRLEHLQMIDATRDHRLVEIAHQLEELTFIKKTFYKKFLSVCNL
jgi:hypothetical protein